MTEPDPPFAAIRTGWRQRCYGLRWWWFIGWLPALGMVWTVCHAPAWLEPHRLTVTLEPGQSVVLDREVLWAAQADRDHLLLRRETEGGWRLTNLSSSKQVLWQPAGEPDYRSIREWPLTPGAQFTVGSESFTVLAADAHRLVLQGNHHVWEYDGVRLQRDGQPAPECYPDWRNRWRNGLVALGWDRLAQRPLRLGGGVYCADRLGVTGVAVDTVAAAPIRAGFVLQPGEAGSAEGSPVITVAGTPAAESLWRRSIPLAVGDRLIIGRTRYQVVQTTPQLELAVLARVQRRLADTAPPVTGPAVAVQWRPIPWLWPVDRSGMRGLWSLVLPPLAILAMGLIWPGLPRPWSKRLRRWKIASALTLASACLGAYLASPDLPVLWPYWLAWPALGFWLAAVRSPWSVRLLAALTLLLGSGLMTLLQLGVGAGESGWLRYGGGNAALTGLFGWLVWAVWTLWQGRPPLNRLNLRLLRWSLRLLGGAALLLLAGQLLFGDEQGWAGLQPFELTKLALIATAAYALMRQARSGQGAAGSAVSNGLRYLWPVALLVVVGGFALLFLRDFSPLALLSPWALAMGWVWLEVQPHRPLRRSGQTVLLTLIMALAVGLSWLQNHPDAFPLDFQADRIRVWAAPDRYPHAGYQLRRAQEAIRAGGWWGTVWTEAANGRVMNLPAVENDFTLAFFLNRYGSLAGLVLAGIQAALIGLLLVIADRALDRSGNAGRLATPGGFAGFALYGGAALLGAHFLVSWGTNLGFLPVMGQPMPLLSAAGSHLTLFVLPVIALAVAVEEQNHDDSR